MSNISIPTTKTLTVTAPIQAQYLSNPYNKKHLFLDTDSNLSITVCPSTNCNPSKAGNVKVRLTREEFLRAVAQYLPNPSDKQHLSLDADGNLSIITTNSNLSTAGNAKVSLTREELLLAVSQYLKSKE